MKRCLFVLLLLILIPVFCFSESYTPALEMTVSDFVSKYNAVSSSLNSSLVSISVSDSWYDEENQFCTYCFPDAESDVSICLVSRDFSHKYGESAGLDMIRIVMSDPKDYLSFLTVCHRCTMIFADEYFSDASASINIYDLLMYYFENCEETKIAHRNLDSQNKLKIRYFQTSSSYCFIINRNN